MKYYVGVRPRDCIIFRSNQEPTQNVHPRMVSFCFGPYRLRKSAERSAMWQNYRIVNDRTRPIPIWDGLMDSPIMGYLDDGYVSK
jgi:hypothetical protein